MKKYFFALVMVVVCSCVYHDISIEPCYLASEETPNDYLTFHYNNRNELISYSSFNIYSSALTYDGGKIVSELDNEHISITYSYDDRNRLTTWSQTALSSLGNGSQTKFFYNGFDQDTLHQFYLYDPHSDSYNLWRYTRLDFASPNTKSYSQRRTYDAVTDTLLYTEDFLWDNHPNPYLSNAFFLNEPPPSNNMTQHTITIAGNVPQTFNYSYTYNENKFPLERKFLPDNIVITNYTYTNCH